MKKKSFTMIEVIIITTIVSIGLLSMFFAVNNSKNTVNHIRQKTIANQLAKEGIELMYQIRNTNLLQHSGDVDDCWLKMNPYGECDKNNKLSSGYYIFSNTGLLTKVDEDFSGDLINYSNLQNLELCLSGSKWLPCLDGYNRKYGRFFRVIVWCKESEEDGESGYSFSSKVHYLGKKLGIVEIEAVMAKLSN